MIRLLTDLKVFSEIKNSDFTGSSPTTYDYNYEYEHNHSKLCRGTLLSYDIISSSDLTQRICRWFVWYIEHKEFLRRSNVLPFVAFSLIAAVECQLLLHSQFVISLSIIVLWLVFVDHSA